MEDEEKSTIEQPAPVVEDAPLKASDFDEPENVWKSIAVKLLNNFMSRKFIILVMAAVAFWVKPEHFNGNMLLIVFGIYTGASSLDKLFETMKR